MLAAAWAPFFSFLVLAPFVTFAEIAEPSASFLVGAVMSSFAPLVQLSILVQMMVGWGHIRTKGLVLLPKLVPEPVAVVLVPVECVRPVPIPLPSILLVQLISRHVLAYVPPPGFPNSGVETTPPTIGQ